MTKPTLLITGGSGLLGLNWACAMRASWNVVLGIHRQEVHLPGVTTVPLDLENPERARRQIQEVAPDVLVHAAGLTSVDACESDAVRAHHVNAQLARHVAEITASSSIRLIHISTDHLFAGGHSFYTEGDSPEPLNEYARSKWQAEQWVRAVHPDALIVRTNFFAWGNRQRQSISDWILAALRAGRTLTMFDDVHFTPIHVDYLADAAHRLSDKGVGGVFNLVGDDRVSKYQFALRLAEAFGLPGTKIRCGSILGANMAAKRPSDMSLSNVKAKAELGADLGGLNDYFSMLRRQENDGRREELIHSLLE